MRVVTERERRSRLAVRHGFVAPTRGYRALADRLVGIHSTDPVSAFVAAAARRAVGSVEEVESALYEDRSVLRMLGMRRTLFVQPVSRVADVQRGYTDGFVDRERKRLAGWLEATGVAEDGARHIERMATLVTSHLDEVGEAGTRELTTAHPELDVRFTPPVGSQTGTVSVGSRVVLLMTAAGRLARTRPLGTWVSSQYRYASMHRWLGSPIESIPAPEARARLADAWLRSYGPGTLTDLKWWAGWNVGETKAALRAAGAVEVSLEHVTGFVAAGDETPVDDADDWVALLPALDSTPMGWKERDWYLGPHAGRLFDRNGNVGPTVWWNGRIVGGWAQRSDGSVPVLILEDVPQSVRRRVVGESERLADFLGDTRFTPRFRTPLERELTAPG
ncbi:MAG TPA: winged helix DNA-binding domain-containing protein [Acidimicrobiia bacterium]|nr:winged helix DNA-binding domain-containing protein [Acidimicrobiia bacterium]